MLKPFDLGNSVVAASISSGGRLVSLNAGHSKHGYIKFCALQSFSNDNWYNPEVVRKYRNSFLLPETADKSLGLTFEEKELKEIEKLSFDKKSNILTSRKSSSKIEVITHVFIPPNGSSIIYLYEVKNISSEFCNVNFSVNGNCGIIRASYGQITENGPIPLPGTENNCSKVDNCCLTLTEAGTESSAVIKLLCADGEFSFDNAGSGISSNPVKVEGSGKLCLERDNKASLALVVSLSDCMDVSCPISDIEDVYRQKLITEKQWDKIFLNIADKDWEFCVNRNLAYTLGCCCLKEFGAMITDHQSLPLTWNRDNYFMFKLLEAVYRENNNPEIYLAAENHLRWLFNWVGKDGWGRSHLINGVVKDRVFQFDQQCYPILELYDFLSIREPDLKLLNMCLGKLEMISELLLDKLGANVMLFETEENPADDPVLYPYHFSTQVLAWRTFIILDIINKKYNFSDKHYRKIADDIYSDIFKYMITESDNKKLFCYTTDVKGNFELYHDANDLPTALAPVWGFLDVDNEIYKNTVDWAFSTNNRGYYEGNCGGLGSDHAKGHWPLGTAQLIAIAIEMIKCNNNGSELLCLTLNTLIKIMMHDGLFSESVKPDTGEVFTRYWFAWPGAAISWLYLMC